MNPNTNTFGFSQVKNTKKKSSIEWFLQNKHFEKQFQKISQTANGQKLSLSPKGSSFSFAQILR